METIGFFSGVLLFSVLCLLPEVRAYLGLLPAYSKIVRTNVKVVKARLLALVQLRTREQAFNSVSDEYGIVEVQVVEMPEVATTNQASVTTLHVSVV